MAKTGPRGTVSALLLAVVLAAPIEGRLDREPITGRASNVSCDGYWQPDGSMEFRCKAAAREKRRR